MTNNKTFKAHMLIVAIFFASNIAFANRNTTLVQRVEPTSWWIGMHNSQLQIKLYGNNIAAANISINYPGVQLLRRVHTDNPNYVFLYLDIAAEAKAGKMPIEIVNGRRKQSIQYQLNARREGSAMRASFSEADAVYLLMPDRFVNGNTQNDNVAGYHQGVDRSDLGQRHGGDIEGIIQKAPYLADLGITALWTTPLFENNDTQYSYHHYATTDYYNIDPRLGTNNDFVRMVETLLKNDIKYIIDVVPNHCGGKHWWMNDIPAKDWFNTWPTYTQSNYRMTAWTDPHRADADLQRLTKGWFAPNMPDFNLKNPLLFDYLRQVYVYWIELANVSGIRVDTYPYNDIQVAANFIQSIRNEYPNMMVVGECWVKTPAETAYYQSGNNNKDGFDSRLQSIMDFLLKDVLHEAFTQPEGWETGMARYYAHYAQDFVYANTNLIMNFLDNHDIDRYSTAVKRDTRLFKMGLAHLLTTRGYPQIYYGTEIMLDGIPGNYEGHRFTIPGGWPSDSRNAFTREGRTADENEIFDYMRTLLHYRKNTTALQSGKMKQFIPYDGIYVYFRYDNNKTVMVVTNNNETEKSLETARFNEMLKGKTKVLNIVSKTEKAIEKQMNIPAKTVLILEIK